MYPKDPGAPKKFRPDVLQSSIASTREPAIKGPSARTRHDVRRVWECPACQRRDWTNGRVVHLLCRACLTRAENPAAVWMHLIEPQRKSPGR
jgi:hypothetical protein